MKLTDNDTPNFLNVIIVHVPFEACIILVLFYNTFYVSLDTTVYLSVLLNDPNNLIASVDKIHETIHTVRYTSSVARLLFRHCRQYPKKLCQRTHQIDFTSYFIFRSSISCNNLRDFCHLQSVSCVYLKGATTFLLPSTIH